MKKVRVFLASAACVVAAAGVYANKASTVLFTFFIPSYANKDLAGKFCSISIANLNCTIVGQTRCTLLHDYPNDTAPAQSVRVSQYVHDTSGETICTDVFKKVNP